MRIEMVALAVLLLLGILSPLRANPEGEPSAAFTVRVVGEGPPILLIPGLSCDGVVWDATIEHLKPRYQCHVFSLAGFAGNPPVEGELLPQVHDQMIRYVKAKELQRPAVIGHSLGGMMAFWLASSEPQLFGPIIAVDGVPFLPALINPFATEKNVEPMARQIRDSIASGGQEAYEASTRAQMLTMFNDQEVAEPFIQSSLKSDPAAVAQSMYELFTTDLRARISVIESPVLLIPALGSAPDEDRKKLLLEMYRAQLKHLPSAQFKAASNCRHFVMIDDSAWFHETIDEFLEANTP
jgi:pimeloyl-ACP methyl ester carboxylesterase